MSARRLWALFSQHTDSRISFKHYFSFCSLSQVAGEQKYHPECFTCLNCRTFIGDGDTYALVERSKLYWWASLVQSDRRKSGRAVLVGDKLACLTVILKQILYLGFYFPSLWLADPFEISFKCNQSHKRHIFAKSCTSWVKCSIPASYLSLKRFAVNTTIQYVDRWLNAWCELLNTVQNLVCCFFTLNVTAT